MGKFVSIFGYSIALLLAGASASYAKDACFSVSGDEAAVANAWAEASQACPCSAARSEKWKVERNGYLKCVRNTIRTAIERGSLRKACKREVLDAARESVCARPADSATCCFTSSSGTQCEIVRDASDCYHHGGRFAALGTSETCLDACADVEGPVCLNHSDCDDGNPCTWDTCDLVNGCWNVNNGTCGPQPTPTPAPGGGGGGGTAGGDSCTGNGESTHGFSAKEKQFFDMVNAYRRSKGKRELKGCNSLSIAAQDHANDMRNKKYFGHDSPNGDTFWERACKAGFRPGCGPRTFMGEILAGGDGDPADTLAQFQHSSAHDEIMKNDRFVVMGLGHSCGGYWGNYWAVTFAASDDASCR